MSNNCFKIIAVHPMRGSIRNQLQKFGEVQVYVPKFKSVVVYVKYTEASSAEEAKKALLSQPHIARIEDVDEWNIALFSTPQESKAMQSPTQSASDEQDDDSSSGERENDEMAGFSKYGISMKYKNQTSLLGPTPVACLYCYNPTPEYECGRCRKGYCNEKCRNADWPKHVDECMP
ncbi:AGAP003302-PA-like protein [Anopheles sinensis]|uniref:AGAP003302-PA-like protein n=1 Tax=Anopheles sinensis TaxID=74873 RepID=A0A084WPH8_ANOSI|nr:AGAP003302-PA-like protein [Anopheles sinensis]